MTSGNWRAKLGLALGSTLVAAGIAWWLMPKRRPATTVATRFIEVPVDERPAAAASSAATTSSDVSGVSPLTDGALLYPASTFCRRPLTDDEWRRYSDVGDSKLLERDSHAYFRYRPNIDLRIEWPEHPRGFFRAQTNSLGLRGRDEVRAEQPDLRILVAGDSHTDGVCDPDESFPKLLERKLAANAPDRSVEALHAGVGGYSFYHYLGALERYLPLAPDVFVVAVYGGNDFVEALTLHHVFQGTPQPPGATLYGEQLEAASAIHTGAVVQGLVSVKYFTQNPDQVEVALQMARDVSTEMIATCRRNGIHPIFVYIPPLLDVEWDDRHAELEQAARALELSREDVQVSDRIGSGFVAFLRSTRVDVVDLREAFRTAGEEMYWRGDYHINLAAHRAIAERLAPLVEAARPAGAVRIRAAAARTDDSSLTSPGAVAREGAGVERGVSAEPPRAPATFLRGRHVALERVERSVVEALFELGPRYEFDELTLFRYAARSDSDLSTNGLGFLGAEEPSPSKPDLRVLFAADEAVFAAGDPGPTCGESIEQLVRAQQAGRTVECLDATTAGWGFFQYAGVWQRSATLAPDIFVVVVDCANDFTDVLDVQRAITASADASGGNDHAPTRRRADAVRSCFDVARSLVGAPTELLASIRSALSVTAAIAQRCRESNARFIVVLLPPASDVRVQTCRTATTARAAELGLSREELRQLERLCEGYRLSLTDPSIELVDFGTLIEASDEVLYDCDTLRLSALGRQRLAEAIARAIETTSPPNRQSR